MIFKDEKGNLFTWKVNCYGVPVEENAQEICCHCNGRGKQSDNLEWIDPDCDWCSGTGKRKLQIRCVDSDLEKYLETFVDIFYREKFIKEATFLGENI